MFLVTNITHSHTINKIGTLDTCQVLKETLRLYPAVPGSMKYVPKGYELSGYVMPEATEVMVGMCVHACVSVCHVCVFG